VHALLRKVEKEKYTTLADKGEVIQLPEYEAEKQPEIAEEVIIHI
jgi:hypothetical protein